MAGASGGNENTRIGAAVANGRCNRSGGGVCSAKAAWQIIIACEAFFLIHPPRGRRRQRKLVLVWFCYVRDPLHASPFGPNDLISGRFTTRARTPAREAGAVGLTACRTVPLAPARPARSGGSIRVWCDGIRVARARPKDRGRLTALRSSRAVGSLPFVTSPAFRFLVSLRSPACGPLLLTSGRRSLAPFRRPRRVLPLVSAVRASPSRAPWSGGRLSLGC